MVRLDRRPIVVLAIVAVIVALGACGSPSIPTAPSAQAHVPLVPPPPAELVYYTLSGLVFEETITGQMPIEGVEVYCDSCGSRLATLSYIPTSWGSTASRGHPTVRTPSWFARQATK